MRCWLLYPSSCLPYARGVPAPAIRLSTCVQTTWTLLNYQSIALIPRFIALAPDIAEDCSLTRDPFLRIGQVRATCQSPRVKHTYNSYLYSVPKSNESKQPHFKAKLAKAHCSYGEFVRDSNSQRIFSFNLSTRHEVKISTVQREKFIYKQPKQVL